MAALVAVFLIGCAPAPTPIDTTGANSAASPATVNLGTAGNYVILAKTAGFDDGNYGDHRKCRREPSRADLPDRFLRNARLHEYIRDLEPRDRQALCALT